MSLANFAGKDCFVVKPEDDYVMVCGRSPYITSLPIPGHSDINKAFSSPQLQLGGIFPPFFYLGPISGSPGEEISNGS